MKYLQPENNNIKNIKQEISLKEKEFINIIEQKHLESAAYILADSGAAGNKYTLTLTTLYTGFQAENNLKLFDKYAGCASKICDLMLFIVCVTVESN